MKILFTDMDGTLLDNNSHVSEHTKEVIKKMTDMGHKFVLASGRPVGSIVQVVESDNLNYKGMYILANNGSTIYDCENKKIIMEKRVPMDMVRAVWVEAIKRGIHIQTYTADSIVTPVHDKEIDVYKLRIHLPVHYTEDPLTVITEEPYKLLAIVLNDRKLLEEFAEDIVEMYGDKITAIFSNDMYLEIINSSSGKGEGLKWLCDHLLIDIKDSYAAGDAMNDLSMIEMAGHGIAMCNGDSRLFEKADIISNKTNDEDGLADIIERLILS